MKFFLPDFKTTKPLLIWVRRVASCCEGNQISEECWQKTRLWVSSLFYIYFRTLLKSFPRISLCRCSGAFFTSSLLVAGDHSVTGGFTPKHPRSTSFCRACWPEIDCEFFMQRLCRVLRSRDERCKIQHERWAACARHMHAPESHYSHPLGCTVSS